MNYIFPKIKDTDKYSLVTQALKIFEESAEAFYVTCKLAGKADLEKQLIEEIMDIYHACETALRIFENKYGRWALESLINSTIEKNKQRGYYEEVEEKAIFPDKLMYIVNAWAYEDYVVVDKNKLNTNHERLKPVVLVVGEDDIKKIQNILKKESD